MRAQTKAATQHAGAKHTTSASCVGTTPSIRDLAAPQHRSGGFRYTRSNSNNHVNVGKTLQMWPRIAALTLLLAAAVECRLLLGASDSNLLQSLIPFDASASLAAFQNLLKVSTNACQALGCTA